MPKKVTNEDFIKKLKEKWGDEFTPLEEYVKRDYPILVRHNKCGYEWKVQPGNLLNNKGSCPKCAGNVKFNDDYINEKLRDMNIEIVGKYKGANKNATFRCKICGCEWEATSYKVLNHKSVCYNCNYKSRKKDINIVEEEISSISGGNIEMIGEYNGVSEKSKFRCKICGCEWETYVSSILSGHSCPNCSIINNGLKKRIAEDEFIKRIKNISGNKYTIISKYLKYDKDIKIKCNDCGYEFITTPSRFISKGCRCNGCYRKSVEGKYEIFINNMRENWEFEIPNDNVLLDEIKFTCKKCGNVVYKSLYYALRQGVYCRSCNPTGSGVEDDIFEKIPKNFTIHRNKIFKYGSQSKELDFYIPELKIGIEYDGLYWHSTTGNRNRQFEKMKFFNDNFGIRVIFIREDEWFEKRDIVIGRLRNIMKDPNIIKVPARKLIVKEVSNFVKNEFLDRYHIQGKDNSLIRIGLYTKKGQLASIMTFGKTRRSMSGNFDCENNVYELIRYSSRIGYNIQGGFSKLLKHSIEKLKELGCEYIKTFADLRWSFGNVYEKNGFKLDHISSPNYVYCKNRKTYSRIQFQKHKLKDLLEYYNPKLSEKENMILNGYSIYWDCGNLVYYMKI